jgi:hypothetical protein
MDPATGAWKQSSTLNGPAQGLFDQTMAGQSTLTGQIGAGLDLSGVGGMPQVGGYNQQAIDAWNALSQPDTQRQSDAARARAAAMGITLGSDANNDVERNIGVNEATQRNQAILQGMNQGNIEFNQGMGIRQQGEKEALDKYNSALSGNTNLTGVRQSLDPNKWNASTPAGAAYIPQTIYGAAQDTFNAQRQNENADIAQRNSNIQTGVGAVGALGGISGIASGLSGLGGLASSAYGGLKSLFGGGSQGITDQYGYGDPTWGSDWGAPSLGYSNAPTDYFGAGGGWGDVASGSGYDTSGLGSWGGSGSQWTLSNGGW